MVAYQHKQCWTDFDAGNSIVIYKSGVDFMDGTEGVYVGKHARYRQMVSEVDQEGGRQLGYGGQNL